MKKTVILIFCLCFCFLDSCGSTTVEDNNGKTEKTDKNIDKSGKDPSDDKSTTSSLKSEGYHFIDDPGFV